MATRFEYFTFTLVMMPAKRTANTATRCMMNKKNQNTSLYDLSSTMTFSDLSEVDSTCLREHKNMVYH